MYSVQNLSIHFTGTDLFKNISFLVNEKDRIGLTGRNGAGKSTLLKILSKQMEASSGKVIIPNGKTIGYLPQHMSTNSDLPIIEEAMTAFAEHIKLEAHIEDLTAQLATRDDYETDSYSKLIEELNVANDHFHIMGGQSREGATEKVLAGLGFDKKELNNRVNSLSGGWKMRIELAKILLQQPDLILLDEPTNHLDIESIQWLETFLANYQGAVVLVSHDRAFLDGVTNRTIEISGGRVYDYKCSYSKYVEQRKELMDHQKANYENQQKEIKEVEDFIERFRYKATKAKQVQSRVKMLERMDRIEVDLMDTTSIHFRFPPAPSSGKVVVEAIEYHKSYGKKEVLKPLDLVILKNEFIAFVGKNGMGKTTLAKSIIGELQYGGELKLGHNVKIGYYAQNQADLMDESKTVFETIDDVAVGEIRKHVKGILGSFLFRGEDLDKRVKVLSGGERSRLALAKLMLDPVNLLILDEPTNHLDMQSKDILKAALLQYDGTLILVSHDRDFLKGLSNKVFEFKDKGVKEHIGDISYFLEKRRLEDLKELEINQQVSKAKTASSSSNKEQYLQRKESEKAKRKVQKAIDNVENEIEELESMIAIMDEQLSRPEDFNLKLEDGVFYAKYKKAKQRLSNSEDEWDRLGQELDSLN
ncbi:MAG: ABC-F family ATP-binding cassette domain-containing protein [Bacteroidales bacterium]|nr:ABC-F family ATP-binding cassette domain-containing protein [Bacteroidales bacterium]